MSSARRSILVPSWNKPALTSMSLRMCSKRPLVVTTLRVGTNGKLVIAPLPVEKAIALQPHATCPAMLSRSLPGESMNMKPPWGSRACNTPCGTDKWTFGRCVGLVVGEQAKQALTWADNGLRTVHDVLGHQRC